MRSNSDLAADGTILKTTNILDMKRLGKAAFSRDCLEVDIDVGSTKLTLLLNHFKAQEFKAGIDTTTQKRYRQAQRARLISHEVKNRGRHPILLGDLNKDIAGEAYDGSLDPLVDGTFFVNPTAEAIPKSEDRWTHYYSSKGTVSQLDYVLVDADLRSKIRSVKIFRGGLTIKCAQYAGPRVGTISSDDLEASDHCALSVDLDL